MHKTYCKGDAQNPNDYINKYVGNSVKRKYMMLQEQITRGPCLFDRRREGTVSEVIFKPKREG